MISILEARIIMLLYLSEVAATLLAVYVLTGHWTFSLLQWIVLGALLHIGVGRAYLFRWYRRLAKEAKSRGVHGLFSH
jgi:hypothetical protein